MTGWECPRCHRCYAPTVAQCTACPGEGTGVTTSAIPPIPYVPGTTTQPMPAPWPPATWTDAQTNSVSAIEATVVNLQDRRSA